MKQLFHFVGTPYGICDFTNKNKLQPGDIQAIFRSNDYNIIYYWALEELKA